MFLLDLLKRAHAKFWQSKCFCSQSRLRGGWFSQKQLPLKKKRQLERRCFLFLWEALKTGTSQEIYKDRGEADSALLGAENDKRKRKASKPGGRGGNAKLGIIRKEIYCAYSKAVTLCLLQESNTVLIKEVNHFPELWHEVWLPSPRANLVVIKNFVYQSIWENMKVLKGRNLPGVTVWLLQTRCKYWKTYSIILTWFRQTLAVYELVLFCCGAAVKGNSDNEAAHQRVPDASDTAAP